MQVKIEIQVAAAHSQVGMDHLGGVVSWVVIRWNSWVICFESLGKRVNAWSIFVEGGGTDHALITAGRKDS